MAAHRKLSTTPITSQYIDQPEQNTNVPENRRLGIREVQSSATQSQHHTNSALSCIKRFGIATTQPMDTRGTPAQHMTENRQHHANSGNHLSRSGAVVNALAENRLAAARDQRADNGQRHNGYGDGLEKLRGLPRCGKNDRIGGESVQIEGAAMVTCWCRHQRASVEWKLCMS